MKTGFHDPIEVKEGKHKKSPWDFTQPPYDERTSCYVNAGTHYGVGHNQPVGHSKGAKPHSPCLPMGRVNTMKTDEIPRKDLEIEFRS
jgi:hypothetical protein